MKNEKNFKLKALIKEGKPTFKRDEKWAKAKILCRLNQEDVAKAKKLGLTPETLMQNIPSKEDRWKSSLKVKIMIKDLYAKAFPQE